MRIAPVWACGHDFALAREIPRIRGASEKRGTQESNLALRFWRPPCYRYTSPPGTAHSTALVGLPVRIDDIRRAQPGRALRQG